MVMHAQVIELVTSTENACWKKGEKVKVYKANPSKDYNVSITSKKAQQIDGFGGCFSELGWDALIALDQPERDEIIREIFSPEGANFNYNRIPMGASDFALSFYSCNDVIDDFDMVNFNIDRDKYILLNFIKSAQAQNPDMKFFASPWSPPAWMKTNNHYASTHSTKGYNGLGEEKANGNYATAFRMTDGYLSAYATYFAKYIKAYAAEGVKINVVYPQNEPCSNQVFPSCKWRAEDLAYFIGKYLGPKFESEGIDTEIYFGTANTSNLDYSLVALNDELASKYIKGVGYQWSGKKSIPVISKKYPSLKYMQTESECGNGNNTWEQAEYTWSLMNQYLTNGASVYAYWNIALNSTGLSSWGWRQNALISIDKDSAKYVFNPEYYIMKHVSHFVQRGAHRLETNGGADHIAFENPDGSIILVIVNSEAADKHIDVQWDGKVLSFVAKAHSFNTLKIK